MPHPVVTGSALVKRLASQVRILPYPTPWNLNQSRQILAALQKFGEVVTYRNLKYDIQDTYSSRHRPILAIFDSGDAAHRAIAASPLTVTLSPDPSNPTEEPRTVTCTIEESGYNHAGAVTRNPFHGSWGITRHRREIYQEMLGGKTRVPLRGLADVLQSTGKYEIKWSMRSDEEKEVLERSCSLMRLWKEGIENAEKEADEVDREKDKERSGLRRVSRKMQRREKDEEDEIWGHGH